MPRGVLLWVGSPTSLRRVFDREGPSRRACKYRASACLIMLRVKLNSYRDSTRQHDLLAACAVEGRSAMSSTMHPGSLDTPYLTLPTRPPAPTRVLEPPARCECGWVHSPRLGVRQAHCISRPMVIQSLLAVSVQYRPVSRAPRQIFAQQARRVAAQEMKCLHYPGRRGRTSSHSSTIYYWPLQRVPRQIDMKDIARLLSRMTGLVYPYVLRVCDPRSM